MSLYRIPGTVFVCPAGCPLHGPTRRERAAAMLTDADIDGLLADETPICDLCGRPEDQDPTNGREYDWNGETGCHQSCEERQA